MAWNVLTRQESERRNDVVPLPIDPMDKALPFAISAAIVGFGCWILIAGLSSTAPAFWTITALIPIVIGLSSAFGPK